MLATALVLALYAALAIIGLGALLLPLYLWVQYRDSRDAPAAAAALAEAEALLRDIERERLSAR